MPGGCAGSCRPSFSPCWPRSRRPEYRGSRERRLGAGSAGLAERAPHRDGVLGDRRLHRGGLLPRRGTARRLHLEVPEPRTRPRTVEGPQVHGHTRLEVIWTVIPVIILAVIAARRLRPAAEDRRRAGVRPNPINITVEGHQFYWQFDYPNARARRSTRCTSRSEPSSISRSSRRTSSTAGGSRRSAARSRPSPDTSTTRGSGRAGRHIRGPVRASSAASTTPRCSAASSSSRGRRTTRTSARQAAATIGEQEWKGVCATCHGNLGQGGYGPNIASNSIIVHPAGLTDDSPARLRRRERRDAAGRRHVDTGADRRARSRT